MTQEKCGTAANPPRKYSDASFLADKDINLFVGFKNIYSFVSDHSGW